MLALGRGRRPLGPKTSFHPGRGRVHHGHYPVRSGANPPDIDRLQDHSGHRVGHDRILRHGHYHRSLPAGRAGRRSGIAGHRGFSGFCNRTCHRRDSAEVFYPGMPFCYFRIPICLLVIVMAATLLKPDVPSAARVKIDLPGALVSSSGLACLIFGVSQIEQAGD